MTLNIAPPATLAPALMAFMHRIQLDAKKEQANGRRFDFTFMLHG
jgi:hypothetical protein